ncbi:MAG: cytosine/adenosine deaminase-related metal-dependent hydrolase [Candidatus Binatia bacterium]|jgi:cytosine/adenosine deaminase-related metal-dependent hydrolase
MPQPDSGLILRARVVLPVSRQPIDNGAVFVVGDRIVSVGAFPDLRRNVSAAVADLGNAILLPGLINSHCHLDYTGFAGQVPAGDSFVDWLKRIIHIKRTWTEDDYRESWVKGAGMLLRGGVTTVADTEAVPSLIPSVWDETPLRVLSLLEMTGVLLDGKPESVLSEFWKARQRTEGRRGRTGLSPHSLYSTVPGLVLRAAAAVEEWRLPLSIHLAESDVEMDMFQHAKGEMFDWVKDIGREMSDCGGGSPVALAGKLRALSKRTIAVHVNHLGQGDAETLARNGASVAHCPGSHKFFDHARFPHDELRNAGVNICLGTDSLASMPANGGDAPVLSMFDEMRRFASVYPDVESETVLRMATINGADALGEGGERGELSEDAKADIIAIPFAGKTGNAAEAAVAHRGDVSCSMVGGAWVIKQAV